MLALFSLPLVLLLPSKRKMAIILNTMLYLCGALLYILPNPLMPDDVRVTHLIINAAILAVYGGLAGFLLHTCLRKAEAVETEEEPEAPAPAAPGKKPAPKVAAKPAPAKR